MSDLVPVRARAKGSPRYGTRAHLTVGEGAVEGYLALAAFDTRAGTASYALRVVNQSGHALRARMTCASMHAQPILAYPLDVQIAPYSICETLLPVRMADVGPYDRAIVQIAGGDVAFSLEAPAPAISRVRSHGVAIALAAVAVTLAAGLGAAAATPRINVLAAPARMFPQSTLDVPYAYGGWAAMQYALKTRDGRQLSAGLAARHAGTLHFNVPASAGRAVLLDVHVAGPFGSQTATSRIAIAAPALRSPASAAPIAPRISEFKVVTPVVQANNNITFTYATNARTGGIWLIDDSGRLWASAPIAAAGTTTIHVPQGSAGRQIRAVLHARIGAADTLASIALTVFPGALVTQNAPSQKAAGPVLVLSKESALAGDIITVAIVGEHGRTQISLRDAAGNVVESGDIAAQQSAVALNAPGVLKSTPYFVTANLTQGIGEQTLVRKLLVNPRE